MSTCAPLPLVSGEELGGDWGTWGMGGTSRGMGGERLDCLTCNAGMSCKMLSHMCGSSLNRNLGKYQLPHMWDNILQDTPALQVKQSNLPLPLLVPPLPQVPQPPLNSSLQTKGGGTCTLSGKYSNRGCLNTPKLPYTPMFPHSSLQSSAI